MLEFEETIQPMKAHVEAPTGFVVVPIEEYNKLLLAAHATNIPVKVQRSTWNDGQTIEATIDSDWLLAVGEGLAMEKYGAEVMAGYRLTEPDAVYSPGITIATRRPTEPEEL